MSAPSTPSAIRTALAFVALSLVAYARVLPAGFVADDFGLIGPLITDGFYMTWGGFFRPLTALSFAFDASVYGTWAPGFHVTNVILHGLVGALLAAVLTELFTAFSLVHARTVALFSAASFIVLPNHTEAVSWVAGRGDLLATLFGLGATRFFLRGMERGLLRDGALATLLTGLALFSKELGVVWPPVLFVLGLASARSRGTPMPRGTKITLFAMLVVLAIYLGVRASVLEDLVGGYGTSRHVPRLDLGLVHALTKYVVRVFTPATSIFDGVVARVVLGLILIGLVTLAVRARSATNGRILATLAVCFGIAIAPTLTLGLNYRDTEGERFLYLPSLFTVAIPFVLLAQRAPLPGTRAFFVFVLGAQAIALDHVNANWAIAAELAGKVADALHPYDDRTTAILNLPDNYHGAYVLRVGVDEAVRMRGTARTPDFMLLATHDVTANDVPYTLDRSDERVGITLREGEAPQYVQQYGRAPSIDGKRITVSFEALPASIETVLVYVGGRGAPFRAIARPLARAR